MRLESCGINSRFAAALQRQRTVTETHHSGGPTRGEKTMWGSAGRQNKHNSPGWDFSLKPPVRGEASRDQRTKRSVVTRERLTGTRLARQEAAT
ncbi:unnamed protein product [Arctogadus glacialis]